MHLSVIIAGLAFLISLANFAIILWDRRPHLDVGIEDEVMYGHEEDIGYHPVARRLWIDISNRSARRIKVSFVRVEWRKWRFWARRKAVPMDDMLDLQRGDGADKDSTTRFWIEPWGDAILSLDMDELENYLGKRIHRKSVWINTAVRDVLDRSYRSNRIKVELKSDSKAI